MVEVVGQRQDHLSGIGCSGPTDHLGHRREGHVAAGRDPQPGARQIEMVVRAEMALDGVQQRGFPLHSSIAMQARIRVLERLRQGAQHPIRRTPAHHALGQGEGSRGGPHPATQLGNHRLQHPIQGARGLGNWPRDLHHWARLKPRISRWSWPCRSPWPNRCFASVSSVAPRNRR